MDLGLSIQSIFIMTKEEFESQDLHFVNSVECYNDRYASTNNVIPIENIKELVEMEVDSAQNRTECAFLMKMKGGYFQSLCGWYDKDGWCYYASSIVKIDPDRYKKFSNI